MCPARAGLSNQMLSAVTTIGQRSLIGTAGYAYCPSWMLSLPRRIYDPLENIWSQRLACTFLGVSITARITFTKHYAHNTTHCNASSYCWVGPIDCTASFLPPTSWCNCKYVATCRSYRYSGISSERLITVLESLLYHENFEIYLCDVFRKGRKYRR